MMYHNNLRPFYIVVTEHQRWGRSLKLSEALKIAKVKRGVDHAIYIGLCKPLTTDDQLDNIAKCFNVTPFGGVSMYTDGPDLEADQEMVNQLFIGWATERVFKVERSVEFE